MKKETKQLLFKYVTTPIARVLDMINIPKQLKLHKIRRKIAEENKRAYIEQTMKVLMETDIQEHLNQGMVPNPFAIPILIGKHTQRAIEMFYEKKQNGDFDELNCMLR